MMDLADNEVKSEEKPKFSGLEDLQKELESVADVECKLQKVVDCMESSIAQAGSPNFKTFWEARKLCIELFKEQVNPSVRSILWEKYCELSREAYRLKELLDKESAFAVEQIDIAVKSIEEDIKLLKEELNKEQTIELPQESQALNKNYNKYQEMQGEISLLNIQATRITSLRKELINTQMRIKQKNKFFKRLSAIGDEIFPRRKELIKGVSDLFIDDIDQFVNTYFATEQVKGPLFRLRDEIKTLQSIAKVLTLNSRAFAHSRKKLSECWDMLKELDKERKKERLEQKEEFQKNASEILPKIDAFAQEVKEEKLSIGESDKQVEQLLKEMRDVRLGREEVQQLRDAINKAQEPILEKKKLEEEKRLELQRAKEQAKLEKFESVKSAISELEKNPSFDDLQKLEEQIQSLEKEIKACGFSSAERKIQLQRLIPLKDQLQEKREEELLALPEDQKEALRQLKIVLAQKTERRKSVKQQLETMRKASGSSGLDFEQSMSILEEIGNEKERLEKIDHSIQDVENQIAKLKKGA